MRCSKLLLDVGNGTSWIQVLWTNLGAVHDGMATVKFECIIQIFQTFLGGTVTGILDPTVRLHQNGRSQVLVGIPPVGWTGRRATGAQNALVHSIQLGPILLGLQVLGLPFLLFTFGLQPRFDGAVLLVEVAKVWDQILDDVHMRQRVDLRCRLGVVIDVRQACQRVAAVDVHGAGSTDALAARSAECKRRVLLGFDLEERV
mmetsp:Transcript_10638/g.30389  ORF Transcript_10638/g.30389 Transcript_10638/m.30389 type:complete len:202 (-) Transcript_10638:58-663(-)